MKKLSLMDRLRLKKTASKTIVGLGWYDAKNWAQVKLTATDSERFEESYPEWLEVANTALADIKKTGVNAIPCYIIADELMAWCLKNKKLNNASARAEFVAEKLRSQSALSA